MGKITLSSIYYEFFRIGVQLLGGGYVIVPLMRHYLIDKRGWINEEELINFYALSQTVPGIIAANISAFTGYKLRGKSGAAVALLGVVTSPIITILLIASIVDRLLEISVVQTLFWGVGIAVIILVYLTVKEMWAHSLTDLPSYGMFLVAFVGSLFLNISPV